MIWFSGRPPRSLDSPPWGRQALRLETLPAPMTGGRVWEVDTTTSTSTWGQGRTSSRGWTSFLPSTRGIFRKEPITTTLSWDPSAAEDPPGFPGSTHTGLRGHRKVEGLWRLRHFICYKIQLSLTLLLYTICNLYNLTNIEIWRCQGVVHIPPLHLLYLDYS